MSTTGNDPIITSYAKAPARTISAGGVTYAYRELGPKGGIPVIFFVHLAATLDKWDPRIVDPIHVYGEPNLEVNPKSGALHATGPASVPMWATFGVPLGLCYDASAFSGIGFWMKGDPAAGNKSVKFSLATPPEGSSEWKAPQSRCVVTPSLA